MGVWGGDGESGNFSIYEGWGSRCRNSGRYDRKSNKFGPPPPNFWGRRIGLLVVDV